MRAYYEAKMDAKADFIDEQIALYLDEQLEEVVYEYQDEIIEILKEMGYKIEKTNGEGISEETPKELHQKGSKENKDIK